MAARIDLKHKLHVLTKKEELEAVRVPGKVVSCCSSKTRLVGSLGGASISATPSNSGSDSASAGASWARTGAASDSSAARNPTSA